MSALKGYRKEIAAGAVIAIFGIAILTVVSSYYFPSTVAQTPTNGCPAADAYTPIPRTAFTEAPVSGYTYIATYNTTNGAIVGGEVDRSCQLGGVMPSGPITTVANLNSCNIDPVGSNPNCAKVVLPEAYLNVTSDSNLHAMEANGYVNAFYVDLSTGHLVLIPGVTFNGNYTQAYYNGQPITNGTSLAIPSQ